MTSLKREVTGNEKRTYYIALCGDFAIEEALDLL
jgi:hypothetical protein